MQFFFSGILPNYAIYHLLQQFYMNNWLLTNCTLDYLCKKVINLILFFSRISSIHNRSYATFQFNCSFNCIQLHSTSFNFLTYFLQMFKISIWLTVDLCIMRPNFILMYRKRDTFKKD